MPRPTSSFVVAVFVFLPLLSLVVSSDDVATDADEVCPYELRADQEVDIGKIRNVSGSIKTLEAVNAGTAEECALACCRDPKWLCNMAEYNPHVAANRCILLQCEGGPGRCGFTTNSSHGVQVAVLVAHGVTATRPKLHGQNLAAMKVLEIQQPHDITTASTRPSTRILRTTIRAQVPEETVTLTSPKKAVDATTTFRPQNETEEVEARTNHTVAYIDSLDADKNRSSVGRKGVMEQPKVSTPPTTASATTAINNKSSTKLLPEARSRTLPDTPTTDSSALNETTTPMPARNDTTLPVRNETTAPVRNETTAPVRNETTAPIRNETTTPVRNETTAPVRNETTAPDRNETKIPQDNETMTASHSTSTTPLTTPTVQVNNETTPTVANATAPAHDASSNATNTTTTGDDDDGGSDLGHKTPSEGGVSEEDEARAKAGIHLVVALVIGLLLLLTVVGLVFRRMHDVWQRRHYQRMDFLVDGMYNTTTS